MISFDESWLFSNPIRFPTSNYFMINRKVIAPFWSDNDIRREGTIRYATYCEFPFTRNGNECQQNNRGQAMLNMVNEYIQGTQTSAEDRFFGKWMLIAQWDHVHPSPHGDENARSISESLLGKVRLRYKN